MHMASQRQGSTAPQRPRVRPWGVLLVAALAGAACAACAEDSARPVAHPPGLPAATPSATPADGTASPSAAAIATGAPAVVAARAPAVVPLAQRIPLAALVAAVRAEVEALRSVVIRQDRAATELGRMNTSLQKRGFFRRVPAAAGIAGLESNLRTIAIDNGLILRSSQHRERPGPPAGKATELQPGERWQPSAELLFATVEMDIELSGPLPRVAAFIDALPTRSERLVIANASREVAPGVTVLQADIWYERSVPAPTVSLRWPSLDERLSQAGWDPRDPTLKAAPRYDDLVRAVDDGRTMVPRARLAMRIVADFPRWFARQTFFEQMSTRAVMTRGAELLELPAGAGH